MTDTQSINLTWDLAHPPAKVWRALTDPTLLSRWLMPTKSGPKMGESFRFEMPPSEWWDGIVNCDVQELEPEKRLRYSWKSGKGNMALDTVVTWTLTATASGGTHLALEHTGFVPSNKFAFQGAKDGWAANVKRLEEQLGES